MSVFDFSYNIIENAWIVKTVGSEFILYIIYFIHNKLVHCNYLFCCVMAEQSSCSYIYYMFIQRNWSRIIKKNCLILCCLIFYFIFFFIRGIIWASTKRTLYSYYGKTIKYRCSFAKIQIIVSYFAMCRYYVHVALLGYINLLSLFYVNI